MLSADLNRWLDLGAATWTEGGEPQIGEIKNEKMLAIGGVRKSTMMENDWWTRMNDARPIQTNERWWTRERHATDSGGRMANEPTNNALLWMANVSGREVWNRVKGRERERERRRNWGVEEGVNQGNLWVSI